MRLPLCTLLAFLLVASVSTRGYGQDLVEPVGAVEKVQGGFQFTEGPAATKDGGLYFSDIPDDAIHFVSPEGKITLFTKPAGHSNGLLITSDDRLLGCQMDGQVVEFDRQTGKVAKTLASQFEGKRFNAPNDLVIDSQGGIYFTDPLYRAPEPLPQGIQAVYYISSNGEVSRVTDAIKAPNGIGLSPDQKRLYVIPSMQSKMLVYEVTAPGNWVRWKRSARCGSPVVNPKQAAMAWLSMCKATSTSRLISAFRFSPATVPP